MKTSKTTSIAISLTALFAGAMVVMLAKTAVAGPISSGISTRFSVYQGVLSIVPNASHVLELGNYIHPGGAAGVDIASKQYIYFRPESDAIVIPVAGSATNYYAAFYNQTGVTADGFNVAGKTSLSIPGAICLLGSCRASWPVAGGTVGPGTVNTIAKFGTTTTSVQNSQISDDGALVSIGQPTATTGHWQAREWGLSHYYNTTETYPRAQFGRDLLGSGLPGWVFKSGTSGTLAADGGAIGQPAPDSLALYTSDGSNLVERVRVNGSGNVGIGAQAPGYKLHVYGAVNPRILVDTVSGQAPEFNLRRGSAEYNLFINGGNDLVFWSGADRVTFTDSGSVGIGTISPAYKLDVVGDANGTRLCIAGDCRGTWPTGTITGSGTQNYVPKFNAAGTGILNSTIFDNGTGVGIGTATPVEKLEVTGGEIAVFTPGLVGNNFVDAGYDPERPKTGFQLSNSSDTGGLLLQSRNSPSIGNDFDTTLYWGNDGDDNLRFSYAGWDGSKEVLSEKVRITSAGNVGIGTPSPSVPLEVNVNAENLFKLINAGTRSWVHKIQESNGFYVLRDDNAGADRMVIDTSGNVGIGTNSPSQRLHVVGNVRVTGGGNSLTVAPGNAGDSELKLGNAGRDIASTGRIFVQPESSVITIPPLPAPQQAENYFAHFYNQTGLTADGFNVANKTSLAIPGAICLSGSCRASWPAGGTVGPGTQNTIPKFNNVAGTTVGNSQITDDSLSVRVAQSDLTPGAKLIVHNPPNQLFAYGSQGDAIYAVANSENAAISGEQRGSGFAGYFSGNVKIYNGSLKVEQDGSSVVLVGTVNRQGTTIVTGNGTNFDLQLDLGEGISIFATPQLGCDSIQNRTVVGINSDPATIALGLDHIVVDFAVNNCPAPADATISPHKVLVQDLGGTTSALTLTPLNQLGIGTYFPKGRLQVGRDISSTATLISNATPHTIQQINAYTDGNLNFNAGTLGLNLHNNSLTNNNWGRLSFSTLESTGGRNIVPAMIAAQFSNRVAGGFVNGDLAFFTSPGGGSGLAERMRIRGNGNIDIGGIQYAWPAAQGGASTVLTNNGSGGLTWTAAGGGGVTGSGLINRLAKFTATGSNIGDSDIWNSGNRVAWGTGLGGFNATLSIGNCTGSCTWIPNTKDTIAAYSNRGDGTVPFGSAIYAQQDNVNGFAGYFSGKVHITAQVSAVASPVLWVDGSAGNNPGSSQLTTLRVTADQGESGIEVTGGQNTSTNYALHATAGSSGGAGERYAGYFVGKTVFDGNGVAGPASVVKRVGVKDYELAGSYEVVGPGQGANPSSCGVVCGSIAQCLLAWAWEGASVKSGIWTVKGCNQSVIQVAPAILGCLCK